MRPVNTLRLAGKALALAVLLFSYSTSKAATLASTIDNPDGSHALQQGHQEDVQGTLQGAAPPARLYRTHDNGNYHRFHSDSSSYTHSQTIIVSRPANTTAMAAAKYDTDMPAGQICNSDDITIFLKTDISATITMDAPITGSSIPWWVVRFSIVCSDRGLRVTED